MPLLGASHDIQSICRGVFEAFRPNSRGIVWLTVVRSFPIPSLLMSARANIRSDATDTRMATSHLLARPLCTSFWKWESGEGGRV